jgi:phosphate/sulfate permease
MQIETTKKRLEVSGFQLDDDAVAEIGPWMRWSTSLCALFMILGTVLASPWVLWALAITAFAGSVLPNHPFDYGYNHGVRHITKTRPLPANTPARKFACGLATVWLTATGLAFFLGANTVGYVLGALLASVAGLVSITHICIPSMIYNALFGVKPRETAEAR